MRNMKRALIFLFGLGLLLTANDQVRQKIQVTKTEHADLSDSGTLHLKNSTGEVTIEAWDQPGVEITTIKSTKLAYPAAGEAHDRAAHDLDAVQVAVTNQTDGLTISTTFPRGTRFLPRPSVGSRDFDLEYRIKAPKGVKIIAEHDAGEIHIVNMTGDVRATTNQGTITLQLPASGAYSIDAKSRIGSVTSDFPGTTTRHHLGHAFAEPAQASHNLYLRTGYGDIIILKNWQRSPK